MPTIVVRYSPAPQQTPMAAAMNTKIMRCGCLIRVRNRTIDIAPNRPNEIAGACLMIDTSNPIATVRTKIVAAKLSRSGSFRPTWVYTTASTPAHIVTMPRN